MAAKNPKIDKTLRPHTLWAHPEGREAGSIFVQSEMDNDRGEEPADVLSIDTPFVVFQKQAPEQIRFYNRSAIIRTEYPKSGVPPSEDSHTCNCQLMMLGDTGITNPGSTGKTQESRPSEYARMYDYLNPKADRFIKLNSHNGTTLFGQ